MLVKELLLRYHDTQYLLAVNELSIANHPRIKEKPISELSLFTQCKEEKLYHIMLYLTSRGLTIKLSPHPNTLRHSLCALLGLARRLTNNGHNNENASNSLKPCAVLRYSLVSIAQSKPKDPAMYLASIVINIVPQCNGIIPN